KQYQIVEEFGATGSERPIPKFTEKIPWVKVSQRVFVTGLNEMNWAIYLKYDSAMTKVNELYATGEKKSKEGEAFSIENNMKDFSRMLSDMTGRASLGRFAAIAPIANALFFSMRLNLGRLLTPRHLLSPNQFVRAEAWKNLSLFVGTMSSVILMGSFLDWWDVELDKRSADFMKIRIGNIRVDPWGGHLQFVVFFSRMYEKTGLVSTTGAEYPVDPISLMTYFLRTKGAPLANLILEFITGKTFFGDKLDITDISQWLEKVVPFALRDIFEAFTEQGLIGAMIALPAIVGANVQAYKGDWEENVAKIGLPKYDDNVPYNIKDPIYDLLDFWADTASDFRGVDPATLTDSKGFTPLIRSVVEAYSLLTEINQMPNQRLTALNADPDEGLTYEDYYAQWKRRLELVASGDKEALQAFDADERTSHAYWGNFSKRQLYLLKEYHSLSPGDQAAFLKENLELYANPRDEWLRTHSKENALLALFGKADIFSIAAYNEVHALAKELDIPASAMVLKELDRITQLNLSYYEQNNLLDVYGGLDNNIEDENGETARSRAIDLLKKDNPNWVDDMRRIEALRVGTDEVPTPTEFVDAWADRGHVIDEFGSGSIEAKLWLLDNKNVHQWALD
ncbi:hypothetical protein LCGC14_2205470, partial [marine sediment metagenome]